MTTARDLLAPTFLATQWADRPLVEMRASASRRVPRATTSLAEDPWGTPVRVAVGRTAVLGR